MKKKNFREYNQSQAIFHPILPADLLPPEHPARIIDKVIEKLDLKGIYSFYKTEGNPSYHPKMMLKVLFYSYYDSTRSSRKIKANLTNGRADFIFLSGGQSPDHRTINDFRTRHIDELPKIFSQIVLICTDLGLIGFDHFSTDGQKIHANASFKQSYDKDRLERRLEKIKVGMEKLIQTPVNTTKAKKINNKRIAKLKKENKDLNKLAEQVKNIEGSKKINKTDNDAAMMTHKDGSKKPSYNHQSVVDKKFGITIAVETKDNVDCASDLLSLVDKANDTTGQPSKNVSADSAFSSYEILEEVYTNSDRTEEYYVPDRQLNKKKIEKKFFSNEKFKRAKSGELICPAGKKMNIKTQKEVNDNLITIFEGVSCSQCPMKDKCTSGAKRTVTVDVREIFRNMMRKKLESTKGKEIYRERQWIVEAGHGDDQKNKGWRQHLLRGKQKASLEFSLLRICANIGKIIRYRSQEMLAMA